MVLNNLIAHGFDGSIYPINPRYEEVAGRRCYPSLSDLPAAVDAAFLAVRAELGPELTEEAARCGIPAVFVNASGYADGGPGGAALEDRLRATAHAKGIAICGPNNMGLVNVWDKAVLWTSDWAEARPGPVAVVSQSGSVAIALSQDPRDLGLGYIVTTGGEAVCTTADYLVYLADDERIRVLLLFIESVRDPDSLKGATRKALDRGKRVIAIKVGRSGNARAAVAAHSGALSGEHETCRTFFRHCGIVEVQDLDEMLEAAALFLTYPDPPSSPRTAAVTLSGGEAALVADLAEEAGLSLPPLASTTAEALKPLLPPFATPRNPFDAWGFGWDAEIFARALKALLDDSSYGSIVCVVDPPLSGGYDTDVVCEMAALCAKAASKDGPRIVFLNNLGSAPPHPEVKRFLDSAAIPYLCGTRSAIRALARWTSYRLPVHTAPAAEPNQAQAWRERAAHAQRLSEPEVYRLLSDAGLAMAEAVAVADPDEAGAVASRLGFPVVMKGTAPSIAHKTELGLVRAGLASDSEVRTAFEELKTRLEREAPTDGSACLVVQEMVRSGVELIASVRNDPAFGSIVMVGLGGTLVELLGEIALRIGPVDEDEAEAMLSETRAATLLSGVRGQSPFDLKAAANFVAALSRFGAATHGVLASVEINPLIVLPDGKGALGIDAVLEVRQPEDIVKQRKDR